MRHSEGVYDIHLFFSSACIAELVFMSLEGLTADRNTPCLMFAGGLFKCVGNWPQLGAFVFIRKLF